MAKIGEKLKQYFESKGITQKQIAQDIGVTPQYINSVFNDRKELGKKNADKLANLYGLSSAWLMTGNGDIVTKPIIAIPGVKRASELEESVQKPLLVPPISGMLPESTFKFAAGQTQLVNDVEKVNRYWFLPDCTDCEAVAPVAGTSMLPNLPPGCFVALKRYNVTADNPNTIPFGQIFGIVVEDEHTGEYHGHIKVLRRHKDPNLAAKYWIAHSFNTEEFDDFDISLDQVRSLWIVKQHIVSDIIY